MNMIEIGKINNLKVVRQTEFGFFLRGADDKEEALLPLSHAKQSPKINDEVSVFIYTDSDQQLIATMQEPYAQLNSFAYLRAAEITSIGAFLEWGIEKDLFVPNSEQKREMEQDCFYVVYIYIDELTNRIVASSFLDQFIVSDKIDLEVGQEIDLLVYDESELGYSCIINNTYKGLIYHNDIYKEVAVGEELKGFVRNIREDKLIDVSFQKSGFKNVLDSTEVVLEYIIKNGGYTSLNDKSSPEEISIKLSMSKATFKKAIGILYRHKKVLIKADGVYLVPPTDVDKEAE
jgi:uncharacterized protein